MADVNCNTEFTLKDIRLLFDDPNVSAVVKLITYKGNEYFLSGTLFIVYLMMNLEITQIYQK